MDSSSVDLERRDPVQVLHSERPVGQEPLIRLLNVSKRYAGAPTPALREVDLQVDYGEQLAIIGPSGGGKSTLLNIMATLDEPSSGRYDFDQVNVFGADGPRPHFFSRARFGSARGWRNARLRRKMGFVFQTPFMLANFNVRQNINLSYRIVKGELPRDALTDHMLESLGLMEQAGQSTETVSGGQRQRIAIGRALLHSPRVVFADEPTGSLDLKTAQDMMLLLCKVCEKAEAALILVTHQPELAADFMPRCVGIRDGALAFDKLGATEAELRQFVMNG